MEIYQRMKDLREDRDLSQEDIAKVLQTTQEQVSKYETGRQMMGIDKYIILAKFYNVSIDYLVGLTSIPKTLDGKPYKISKSITINNNGNGYKFNIKN